MPAALALASSPAAKQGLVRNTQAAVDCGAFGAPWIVVDTADGEKHCYFGSDRFELIAHRHQLPYPSLASLKAHL